MKIGIITCKKFPNLLSKDISIKIKLEELGYKVDILIWDDPDVEWTNYNYLLFRSPWDYFEKQEQFLEWINKIKSLDIRTINPINAIEKNVHKFYLKELQEGGINLIDTIFIRKEELSEINKLIPTSWEKFVIKPAISAGSYLTKVFDYDNLKSEISNIILEYEKHDILVQRYMPEIKTVGETSNIYFGGKYSHSVLKLPKEGDFRIQAQFGGIYTRVEISDEILLQINNICEKACMDLVYARIDGIIIGEIFYLMEVELFEPDLYFELCEEGIGLFVGELDGYIRGHKGFD